MKTLEIIIGVYKITNTITGKYYIGYAKNIYKRFNEHRKTLKNGNHQNIILQRSYNKYTLEAFNFEILHQYDNIEDAKNKELEYLENLEIRDLLYNLHYNNSGGDTLTNHPEREDIIKRRTDTINEKFSKMTDKEKKDKYGQSGEKNGMFGKTHTEEVRKMLSLKAKLQVGEKNGMFGKTHTEKVKNTQSILCKTRTGNKNSFYGKKVSDENKKKISESNKARKNNVETSKKITIDDINYNSLSEASEKLKIHITTISWRIKSENLKFENYKYTDQENIKLPLSTKISIDNVEYNSIEEASKKLNVTNGYISRRLNSVDEEDYEWKILDKKRDKRKQTGRKVMINGIIYDSVKEASEKLNIIESTLTKRLNSKEPIPVTPKKSVSIDNVIYESVSDASKQLNKNINVLISHLKSDKFKNCIYLPIEYIDLSKYKYLI
jgi:group I intron endonuclease